MRHSYDCKYFTRIEDGDGKVLEDSSSWCKLNIYESLDDIFEFEFQKHYDKKYNPSNWFLEPNSRLLYKELENKWLKNELDMYDYYYINDEFKDYIINKHMHELSGSLESMVMDNIRHNYPYEQYVNYTISSDNGYIFAEGELFQ